LSTPISLGVGAEIQTTFQFVAAHDSMVEQTLRLPTAKEFVAARCREALHSDAAAQVYIFGRLTTPNGVPIEDVVMSVLRKPGVGDWQPMGTLMRTDAAGFFQFCEADLDDGETVIVRAKGAKGVTTDARVTLSPGVNVVSLTIAGPSVRPSEF
jgi:hypothetical protein